MQPSNWSVDDLVAPDPDESNVFQPNRDNQPGRLSSSTHPDDNKARHFFEQYVAEWEHAHGREVKKERHAQKQDLLLRTAPLLREVYDALENKYSYFDPKFHQQLLRRAADRLQDARERDPVEVLRRQNALDAELLYDMSSDGDKVGNSSSLHEHKARPLRSGLSAQSTTSAQLQQALQRSRPCCSHLVQELLAVDLEYERTLRASPGRSSVAFEISPSPSRQRRARPDASKQGFTAPTLPLKPSRGFASGGRKELVPFC